MDMLANKFEKWFLRMLCKRLVIQGRNHETNIIAYYRVINEEAQKQFTEDNLPTLNGFLSDCHDKSLLTSYPSR